MKFGPKKSSNSPSHPFAEKFETEKFETQQTEQVEFLNERTAKPIDSYSLRIIVVAFMKKLKDSVFLKHLPVNPSGLLKHIQDKSYIFNKKEKKYLNKIARSFQKILKRLIISPDNPFRMLWNIFILIFMSFSFFYIPLEISFEIKTTIDYAFGYMSFLFFSIDVILNFITGEFIKGFLVMNPKVICKNYLKGLFLFDLLAIISSIFYLLDPTSYGYFAVGCRFFILAKIPTFLYNLKLVLNYFKLEYKYQNLIDILKLLCNSLFLAHILACFWHICSQANPQKNWLVSYHIQDESFFIKYIYSLYWVIVTIMTVGYGDICPQNEYETIFSMITIIFGCGLYAFNLNSFGIILENSRKKENQLRDDLRIINRFMDRKNIDISLQRKVQEYLNFLWIEQNLSNNEEESQIMNHLNETLKEELLLESYGGIFLNNPIFLKNFNEKSLRKLVKIIKEMRFIPGDEIFEENVLDDCSLYFVNKGSVEIYLNKDSQSAHRIQVFKKGSIFGEHSFFTGLNRDYSCKTLEFTSVLIINRELAIQILRENKEDYEKFCMIKDKILLQNDYSLLKARCLHCKSIKHSIKNCNHLHFVPDVEQIIKRLTFSKDEQRRTFSRKNRLRISKPLVTKMVKIFQANQDNISISSSKRYTNLWTQYSKTDTLKSFNDEEDEESPSELMSSIDIKKDSEKLESNKELQRENSQTESSCFKPVSSYLTIPTQQRQTRTENRNSTYCSSGIMSSFISKNFKEANPSSASDSKKEKEKSIIVFDTVKHFKNYFPNMNCLEVINTHQKNIFINERIESENNLVQNEFKKDLAQKLSFFSKYSIFVGKFKDLITQPFAKSFRIRRDKESSSLSFSPLKRSKNYSSFFDRNKPPVERGFRTFVSSLMKGPQLLKINTKNKRKKTQLK